MLEYCNENYPNALISFGLSKEEFTNLTFAEYQDMLILDNYNKTLDREYHRQALINALTVVEINKNPKQKKFKDIELYKEEFAMYKYIFTGEEDIKEEKEYVKQEKAKLLAGLGIDLN